MIRGRVNSHEEPEVSITLIVQGRRRRMRAIIDTGFNGYLSVPEKLAESWYFFGHEEYEIATGDIVEQKIFIGGIIWSNRIQEVYAVTSKARDILIGTKLLRKNELEISFPKRKVVIR